MFYSWCEFFRVAVSTRKPQFFRVLLRSAMEGFRHCSGGLFVEPRSVKARRGQKQCCKSAKGKEQKDKPVFQPGMTFFVFERLFHSGRFHEH